MIPYIQILIILFFIDLTIRILYTAFYINYSIQKLKYDKAFYDALKEEVIRKVK